eukprot:s1259_g7.t1
MGSGASNGNCDTRGYQAAFLGHAPTGHGRLQSLLDSRWKQSRLFGSSVGLRETPWKDFVVVANRYTLKAKFGQNAALHGIILIKTVSKLS